MLNCRCGDDIEPGVISDLETDWVFIWIINFSTAWAGYHAARTAAKINIQRISYAVPLVLATPIIFATLIGESIGDTFVLFSSEIR